jgi:ClpP class serine protease
MDSSRYLDKLGVEIHTFTSDGADLKSIGYGEALTESQKEFLQESINEAGLTFKNFVLENRPNIDDIVFRAGWYGGEKSLELGLIDSIGTEYDAVDYANTLANRFSI